MPFSLLQESQVPHLHLTIREYQHSSGLRHIHLDRADPELGCTIGFRTTPTSSNGVAHVLEHLTLSGSKDYPVKDPFFSMIPRSVASFMNALTYPDKTIYPFTTPSPQDYHNLLAVYLDAVFFPNLHELDFAREGWHYEAAPASVPGATPQLKVTGVVFNEMKGVYDNPFATQMDATQRAIFPGTTYAQVSGGDPEHIPELTHDDLLNFHHTFYHPSQAVIVTYGQLDPAEVQATIEDKLFQRYNFGQAPAPLAPPAFPALPVPEATATFQSDNPADHAFYQAWPRSTMTDPASQLVDRFMTRLLLASPTSPLQLKLTEAGLFPADLSGINGEPFRASLALGVGKLTAPEVPRAKQAFARILHEIVAEGVSPDLLASTLRDFQLDVRNTESAEPYGMGLMEEAVNQVLFGGSIVNALDKERLLATILPQLTVEHAQRWLADLLASPCSHLDFIPDPQWLAKRNQAEAEALEAKASTLSAQDWQAIATRQAKLTKRQDFIGHPESLPSLAPSDLPPDLAPLPPIVDTPADPATGHLQHQHVAAPTNQIGQLALVIDTSSLPPEEWCWASLWSDFLLQMGTKDATWQEHGRQLSSAAAKVRATYSAKEDVTAPTRLGTTLMVSATTLEEQASGLPAVLSGALRDVNWHDEDRLRYLLEQLAADVRSDPSQFIAAALGQGISAFSDFSAHIQGPVAARFVCDLARQFKADPASVMDHLDALTQRINSLPRSVLTIGGEQISNIGHQFATQISHPVAQATPASPSVMPTPTPHFTNEAYVTPHEVGAMYQVFPAPPPTSPDYARLLVLCNVMKNGYLHTAIREKGGAYGAIASVSKLLCFASYRDPRASDTFADIERAIAWACAGQFTPAQVSEGIVAAAGSFLRPRTPRATAMHAWSNQRSNYSSSMRNQVYHTILHTTPADLVEVAQRWLHRPFSRLACLPQAKVAEAASLDMEVLEVLPPLPTSAPHP